MKSIKNIFILILALNLVGCNTNKNDKTDIKLNQTNEDNKEYDSIDNYISGNTNISPYYKPETKPNDEKVEYIPPSYDIDTFEYLDLKINDVEYTLRKSTIQDFIKGGFEVRDKEAIASISGNSTRPVTNSYEYIDIYFNNDKFNKNFKCTLKYWNDKSKITECVVYGITIDITGIDNIPNISLEGDVNIRDNSYSVISKYGNPNYSYQDGIYEVLNYENDDYSFKMILNIHDKQGLSIINIEM